MSKELYDYNIWSAEPGQLTLTAYEQYFDREEPEYLRTDTSKYHSITFTAPEDVVEIEHLLRDRYINQYPLTDYDDWVDVFVVAEEAPPKIAQFLDSLPHYEQKVGL